MKAICSINGEVRPRSEANISVSSVEAEYGFGVYETIKVRNSVIYFLDKHIERLFHSASCINLEHALSAKQVEHSVIQFMQELKEKSCNLKLLLYGGATKEQTQFFIIPSAPFYPNRKWYKEGVSLVSYEYERWMPQAKTLNMLASYFFYKKAREQNCYDALFLDHQKNVVEGTRTNIYFIKGTTIYSSPENQILTGVTMLTLKKVLKHQDTYKLVYKLIPYKSIADYDGMFLTSTSSKILPVKSIDTFSYPHISDHIVKLIKIYDEALDKSKGTFSML